MRCNRHIAKVLAAALLAAVVLVGAPQKANAEICNKAFGAGATIGGAACAIPGACGPTLGGSFAGASVICLLESLGGDDDLQISWTSAGRPSLRGTVVKTNNPSSVRKSFTSLITLNNQSVIRGASGQDPKWDYRFTVRFLDVILPGGAEYRNITSNPGSWQSFFGLTYFNFAPNTLTNHGAYDFDVDADYTVRCSGATTCPHQGIYYSTVGAATDVLCIVPTDYEDNGLPGQCKAVL